jgi:hypothetical protein
MNLAGNSRFLWLSARFPAPELPVSQGLDLFGLLFKL